MEFHLLSFASSLVASILFFYLLVGTLPFFRGKRGSTTGKVLPEPAGKWPLIGHLHLLGGGKLLHVVLGEMADKYGPIFSLRLGLRRVLVVSSSEMVKECFTPTNDVVFATRPKSMTLEIVGYNYAMFPFSPNAPYWREMRKIFTSQLMSTRRICMISHVWESEVKEAIRDVYKKCVDSKNDSKALIEMRKWFGHIIVNTAGRMVMVGRRFTAEENQRFGAALDHFMELIGSPPLGEAIPFLRWLDIGGHEKVMKKLTKDIDGMLQRWLDEHKQKKKMMKNDDRDWCCMEALINLVDDNIMATVKGQHFDADTINKATCLVIAIATTESMTISLTYTLALLLNNRKAMKKVQDELDIHVGRARQVKESDMKNLVYLQAIIKESLRLHPPSQITPPRASVADCHVAGYHVPAGTALYINVWKVQRDARIWNDPCEFKPERFLDGGPKKDIDMVRGNEFELIPFGNGRKVCAGSGVALQILQFTLASLLHGFDIVTPFDEPIDMTEENGFTNRKVNPVQVILTPRLPAEVYDQ